MPKTHSTLFQKRRNGLSRMAGAGTGGNTSVSTTSGSAGAEGLLGSSKGITYLESSPCHFPFFKVSSVSQEEDKRSEFRLADVCCTSGTLANTAIASSVSSFKRGCSSS